jgi:hypothetical protein
VPPSSWTALPLHDQRGSPGQGKRLLEMDASGRTWPGCKVAALSSRTMSDCISGVIRRGVVVWARPASSRSRAPPLQCWQPGQILGVSGSIAPRVVAPGRPARQFRHSTACALSRGQPQGRPCQSPALLPRFQQRASATSGSSNRFSMNGPTDGPGADDLVAPCTSVGPPRTPFAGGPVRTAGASGARVTHDSVGRFGDLATDIDK